MNCKNCEYAIKCRSLQDNEWYTRCTYEEGECVKITELEAQIEKMKCCVVSHCEGCERLPELYKELENGNKEM